MNGLNSSALFYPTGRASGIAKWKGMTRYGEKTDRLGQHRIWVH